MRYFDDLLLPEDVKTRYKELAKKHHPDLGGSVETMKDINNQYDEILVKIYKMSNKSDEEIDEILKDAHLIRNKLCEIAGIEDVKVELCGSWIWITGNTKPHKEALKSAGFFWSNNKLAWYWRKKDDKTRNMWHRPLCLDHIRMRHGFRTITNVKGNARLSEQK